MQLVFATNNLNKLKEVQALIPPDIQLLSLKERAFVTVRLQKKNTENKALATILFLNQKVTISPLLKWILVQKTILDIVEKPLLNSFLF